MSQAIVSQDTELISAMFIPPAAQLAIVRRRNIERNWGFTDEDFVTLGEPPAWPPLWPKEKLYAAVLDVSLDTVEQTFDEAWYCAASVQPNQWRWNELNSDPQDLRLLPGITHKRGLRWVVVDLAANWDRKNGISPADVWDDKTSPHSAVLWAARYFPKWVQAMDGSTVPYVWCPGYQVTIVGSDQWSFVPYLTWDCIRREVKLDSDDARSQYRRWAVPSFRE